MSCCGGKNPDNCGCGSSCKCGSGCGECNPDLSYSEAAGAATETLILGVVPQKTYFEGGIRGCRREWVQMRS